jgi:WD40 repeat protein
MGCGSSNGASEPGEEKVNWNKEGEIDKEFLEEEAREKASKKVFDKKSGKVIDAVAKEDREFDFFEGADAGAGDQFMAVRPYEGAIMEPDEHNEESSNAPNVTYDLEYVYGFRCEDSRMNCFYNTKGQATYMTAALGVILDQGSNKQKFFGGGQTDNASKKVARDDKCHTNDITAMDVSCDRTLAATGQNGSKPVAFMWDSCTGDMKARFKLDKGDREVTAIAISPDNKMVALCDNHNDHHIWIFDVASGSKVHKKTTGGDRIYHLSWSQKEGDCCVAAAGRKHYSCWDLDNGFEKKKGIHGSAGKPTSHCCVAWDDKGTAYTGGANSHIYCWEGRTLKGTYDVHGRGFVCAIRYVDGQIISGAKDCKIVISNPADGTCVREIDVGHLVRSVDMKGDMILTGLRNGTILEINAKGDKCEIMKSHCDGEAWGLGILDGNNFVTSGDDNQIFAWSIKDRKAVCCGEICDENKDAKRGGASSMTQYAPSKCGRAIAINKHNKHVAVGHNDGRVTIRKGGCKDLSCSKSFCDSDEWIEAMEYSPDGKYLAVGSHDNLVYIYDAESYEKVGQCKAHNSFIVSVDWCCESRFIRTVCGAHELLFFDRDDGWKQDPSGASNTKGVKWATSHAKFGWLVTGIFPAATDGTHINDVDFSEDGQLIVTGDDYGLVNVWCNPARKGATPISLRGHSEHVVRTRFTEGCKHIISIGGYDKTIMQWKKC